MFDTKVFMKQQYTERTEEVELTGMGVTILVRGLTGEEVGRVNGIVAGRGGVDAIVTALSEGEVAEAFKTAMGIGDDMPIDGVRRIEYLKMGTVEPKITQEVAVKMYRVYPMDVYKATNKILRLTGKGMKLGESKASG